MLLKGTARCAFVFTGYWQTRCGHVLTFCASSPTILSTAHPLTFFGLHADVAELAERVQPVCGRALPSPLAGAAQPSSYRC